MDFRHEYKHEISRADLFVLRQRLRAVAQPDPHAVNGAYRIRSLYFDNAADKALREKLDGVSRREKFRIRCYNNDLSVIHLEKKSKLGGLGNKQSANLTAQQAQAIVDGDCGWLPFPNTRSAGFTDEIAGAATLLPATESTAVVAGAAALFPAAGSIAETVGAAGDANPSSKSRSVAEAAGYNANQRSNYS